MREYPFSGPHVLDELSPDEMCYTIVNHLIHLNDKSYRYKTPDDYRFIVEDIKRLIDAGADLGCKFYVESRYPYLEGYLDPLCLATMGNRLDIVEIFIKADVKVYHINYSFHNPLYWAVRYNNVEMAKQLVKIGIKLRYDYELDGDQLFIVAYKYHGFRGMFLFLMWVEVKESNLYN